jgi:hypothetical protein
VRVNAIAPEAATRLTAWAGDHPDMAPDLVSPLVAWLCDPVSAPVTGRVFEVGRGVVNVMEGWRRAGRITYDRSTSSEQLGKELSEVLAGLGDAPKAIVPVAGGWT